jgi:hypothetical protein
LRVAVLGAEVKELHAGLMVYIQLLRKALPQDAHLRVSFLPE